MWSVVNRDCHQKCKRVMVQNPKANSIQRELVQIEASVQNFSLLAAASTWLPPSTHLSRSSGFGQGGAAPAGVTAAGGRAGEVGPADPGKREGRCAKVVARSTPLAEHASLIIVCVLGPNRKLVVQLREACCMQ